MSVPPAQESTDKNDPGKILLSPELLEIQRDWEELLANKQLDTCPPPPIDLAPHEKDILSALWFDVGTLGVSIDYPQTSFELRCYQIIRSRYSTIAFSFTCLLQMLLPFFEPPLCPWEIEMSGEAVDFNYTDGGKYLSLQASRNISVFCVLVYSLDIALRFVINNGMLKHSKGTIYNPNGLKVKPAYKDLWVLFRCVCCVAMLCETFAFFITGTALRFTRTLVPFMYISRRSSLRKMLHGLLIAVARSLDILVFLVIIVLFGTYVGYVLFHGISLNEPNKFYTIEESFMTTLLSVTSRSYNLFALVPYYEASEWSSLYFIALTVLGDLMCLNLIIAVGNRQYRLFGINTYRNQLRNRRQAFIAVHEVLSDDDGFITRKNWDCFCARIQGKYSVRKDLSNALFSLESYKYKSDDIVHPVLPKDKDVIDCVGLFRLCALLSTRVDFDTDRDLIESELRIRESRRSPLHNLEEELAESDIQQTPTTIKKRVDTVSYADFLIPGHSAFNDDDTIEESVRKSISVSAGIRQLTKSLDKADNDSEAVDGLPLDGETRQKTKSILDGIPVDDPPKVMKLPADQSSNSILCFFTMLWNEFLLKSRVAFLYSFVIKSALPSSMITDDKESNQSSLLRLFWKAIINQRVSPYESFSRLLRYLLLLQIIMFAALGTIEWIQFGWVLEAFLWFEMLMLIACFGINDYFERSGYGFVLYVNVISLIFMILMGSSPSHNAGFYYFAFVIVQMSRFTRLLRVVRGYYTFSAITPLVIRASFIIFAFIYFFAGFAHNRMCNVLNPDKIYNEDDDAEQWLPFQDLLNFKTFLQSLFTLYQISILGNWTPIMGAAAQTSPYVSFFFFFTYRLTMTLAVLPLLFAVIIQAFINHKDKEAHMDSTNESPDSASGNDSGKNFKYQRTISGTGGTNPDTSNGDSRASSKNSDLTEIEMNRLAYINNLNSSNHDKAAPVPVDNSPQTPSSQMGTSRRVSVRHGKGESMMSFWAQGEKNISDAQREKQRADNLQRQLDDVLHQLKLEKEKSRQIKPDGNHKEIPTANSAFFVPSTPHESDLNVSPSLNGIANND